MVGPTVISTFAGCGGSSLGYKLAGFRELLAVEWDDNAAATFRLNFPDVPLYHGDIGKLSVEECLKLSGLKAWELDVFDGSPPCQGFSTAGKRKFNDPRNSLFKEYARLLAGLQPKVFVMENVTGMVKGVMKQAYLVIVRTLRECGYQVRGEVLNAMYYGVPQRRERVILIGVRNDLAMPPSHPKPQTRPITVRQAFGKRTNIKARTHTSGSKLDQCCRELKPGQSADEKFRNWGFQLTRLAWDSVSPTIAKSGGATGLIHPDLPRKLIGQEYLMLASFPPDFKLCGSEADQQDRIGNSVPPLLMRAIAEHIKTKILSIPPGIPNARP